MQLSTRQKILIAIAAVIIIGASGIFYISRVYNAKETQVVSQNIVQNEKPTEQDSTSTPAEEKKEIVVYICGAVKNPSNVKLPKGARLDEALKLAGGALIQADLNAVNLAHILSDEEMVYIPKKGELTDSHAANIPGPKAKSAAGGQKQAELGKVNINTATAEQLDSLPGVGPSTAQKILSYRSANGGFKAKEDLKNVPGIGDSKFDSLKDFITVE